MPRDQISSSGNAWTPRLAHRTFMPGWSRSMRSTMSGRPPAEEDEEYSAATRATMSSRTVDSGSSLHDVDHFGAANAEGSV